MQSLCSYYHQTLRSFAYGWGQASYMPNSPHSQIGYSIVRRSSKGFCLPCRSLRERSDKILFATLGAKNEVRRFSPRKSEYGFYRSRRHRELHDASVVGLPTFFGPRYFSDNGAKLSARPVADSSSQLAGIPPFAQSASIRSRLRQWQIGNPESTEIQPQELQSRMQESNSLTRPDLEDETFEDADREDDDTISPHFEQLQGDESNYEDSAAIMRPGDVLDLPRPDGSSSTWAVYIYSSGHVDVTYLQNGRLHFSNRLSTLVLIRNQFSPEDIAPVMQFIPRDLDGVDMSDLREAHHAAVPRHVGKPIADKLAGLQQQSQDLYRQHAKALNNAHQILAHPTEPRIISLEDAAVKLTGVSPSDGRGLPDLLLHAVSNSLLIVKFGFKVDVKNHLQARYFWVEPLSSAQSLQRVLSSIRAFREEKALMASGAKVPRSLTSNAHPFKKFFWKARDLIRQSRKLRYKSPEGSIIGTKPEVEFEEGSSGEVIYSSSFTRSDTDFIRVLALYVASKSLWFQPVLRNLPTAIVRSTGLYPNSELSIEVVHGFLVEIGVMQPFWNADAYDGQFLLPDGMLRGQISDMEKRIEAGEHIDAAASLSDSMEGLRRDWGDTPIFVVDSQAAVELDDGISVEEIPGTNGHVWIHVHIAHPTAFLDVHSPFAKMAADRLTASYCPDSRIPMLPSWLTARFSLKQNSPVLTFSAKLDASGTLIEHRVEPGIARNVKVVTQSYIDDMYGYEKDSQKLETFAVGPVGPPGPPTVRLDEPVPLSDFEITRIQKLHSIAKLLSSRGTYNMYRNMSNQYTIRVAGNRPAPLAFSMYSTPSQAKFALSRPRISVSVNQNHDKETIETEGARIPSRVLVTECMLLANVVGAKWAAERNIPMPYVGSRKAKGTGSGGLSALFEKLQAMAKGEVPYDRDVVHTVNHHLGRRHASPHPVEFRRLGFRHYTKVTSPLRRYHDLLANWQIDAAIREEFRTGRSLAMDVDEEKCVTMKDLTPACVPFSYDEMGERLAYGEHRGQEISRFSKNHARHWTQQLIARAHYLGETALPDPLVVNFGEKTGPRRAGLFESLQMPCDTDEIVGEDGITEVSSGERWEVKIKSVQVRSWKVEVKPIRKLDPKPIYVTDFSTLSNLENIWIE